MKPFFVILGLTVLILFGAIWQQDRLMGLVREYKAEFVHRRALSALVGVDRQKHLIAMPDGVRLATDVYLPRRDGPVPAVLMRLPYGKTRFGEVRKWMRQFLPAGYAVVVQDMRGRHGSEGVFAPYPNAESDGAATLDWIVAQGWSDGQVGSIGCSALGESQILLAKRRHPAHRAMIPIGAGGAIGTLGDSYGFFGFFEGGIFALASGFGWFVAAGGKTADAMAKPPVDYALGLSTLPLRDAVARFRADKTDFRAFLDRFEDVRFWRGNGFVTDADRFSTPFVLKDTWYDGARESLQLAAHMRATGAPGSVIIGPGLHCDLAGTFDDGAVGDLPVDPAQAQDFEGLFLDVMNHEMRGAPAPKLPPVRYYMLGEDQWRDARQWPPADALTRSFYLTPQGLSDTPPDQAGRHDLRSDPSDPVPTIGGAICCTGDPDLRAGPLFQTPIEGRDDLMMLTGAPLAVPLRIAGPIKAHLWVSADVPDADLVLRLTDVDPQGRSRTIQEGALRLRYRSGMTSPSLMEPGRVYAVTVTLRDIAYRVPVGHRIRLHVAGSSFPRLARNMQGGGAPYAETRPEPGMITLHHGPDRPAHLRLFRLSDD